MSSQPNAARVIHFGLFELDLSAGELRKQDLRIKLQDQPLQILVLLVSRPGEVVTREELQKALWPADTFIEFDQGLNTAIKKIRLALGDSADNPRFVETLPRKGYRFIAPVGEREMLPPTPAPAVRMRGRWWLASASLVAVAAGCALWLLDRSGKARPAVPVPVPLTTYRGLQMSPSFSPEGDRVAFSWDGPKRDNFDIYVKLIGAEEPVHLTKNPAPDGNPAWSPDGHWIAFQRWLSSERVGVFLIPAVGGAERKLTEVLGNLSKYGVESRMSWHPSSQWLVIPDKSSAQEPLALSLVSVETGEKRKLTSPPKGILGDVDPAVSPDGRAVAFTRVISENGTDLYLLELSASLSAMGEPKRITFWQRCTREPAWWPDGDSILFASGASSNSKTLWQMAIRGSARRLGEPERLPFGRESWRLMPAISRQGRVVYMQSAERANIWRLELGGSHRVDNLPMNSSRLDHVPQYSPDGKRIAFASNRSGSDEIWLCDADGSNTVKLTSFGGAYVAEPAWSPDGRRIAFGARPQGVPYIYTVSAGGGKPERLPDSRSSHGAPSWSRDGKWIYFFSDRSGKGQVWKTPANGGEAVQITKQGGAYAVESPDRKFVYYLRAWDQSDNTELWRVPVDGGEEIRIIASLCPQFFAVVERGIYFFSGWKKPWVQCFNFATRKVETVAKVEGTMAFGFSVSPDSRWLLYAAFESANEQSDLMLVEKFR